MTPIGGFGIVYLWGKISIFKSLFLQYFFVLLAYKVDLFMNVLNKNGDFKLSKINMILLRTLQ